MNERDYLIMEAMVLTAGALVVSTIVSMVILFDLPIGVSLFLAMCFIGFTTFFFGLYCHMKRRIYVLEMQELIRQGKEPHE